MLLGSSQKNEEKNRNGKRGRERRKRRKRNISEEKGEGEKRDKSRSMVTLFVSKEKHGRRDLGAPPFDMYMVIFTFICYVIQSSFEL